MRIYALGRTRVESREGPIEGSWLEQRAGQLLKYLICRRGRVAYPDEIEAAIWPNEDAHASGTVRYYVHRLRRQLEPDPPPQGPSSFVIAAMGGYRLAPSVKVDADDFERLARAGLEAGTEGAREQLERAAALYEGDLIPDEPTAPWVFEERERLRTLAEQVLRALLEMDLDRGDRLSALDGLRRLVQLQPFDLGMHRLLLALCIECGRRSEAARRYMALAARLRREFNQELDFELGDLNSEEALRELQEPARLRAAAKDETAGRAAGGQPPG